MGFKEKFDEMPDWFKYGFKVGVIYSIIVLVCGSLAFSGSPPFLGNILGLIKLFFLILTIPAGFFTGLFFLPFCKVFFSWGVCESFLIMILEMVVAAFVEAFFFGALLYFIKEKIRSMKSG